MDNYETCKLLVTSYTAAIDRSTIPSILPDVDLTNKTLVNRGLRLYVITNLLASKHAHFFQNLTIRQISTLLAIPQSLCKSDLYVALLKFDQLPTNSNPL